MKIRVIVATLGERPSLSDTLLSINNQSIAGIEVKIVCPQNQSLIVQHIAQETLQSRFEIILDSEKGLSAAINQGFLAPGEFEYFCWLNDDDELTPQSLNRSFDYLQNNRNEQAVIGTLGYTRRSSSKILHNKVTKLNLFITKIGPNIIPQPGSLIRKSAIPTNYLLNEKYKYAMDLDMWLRIMKYGKIGIIKQTQAIMKWHGDSITVSNRKKASIEAFQIRLVNSHNLIRKLAVIICYLPTRLLSSILSKVS